jgi:hypothetical protein
MAQIQAAEKSLKREAKGDFINWEKVRRGVLSSQSIKKT